MSDARPPIAIAAMGPQMMRYAATHGDTWNTMSFEPDFEARLSDTAARTARMAEICLSVARGPDTLRHSYLMFDPDSRERGHISYYESTDRVADNAGELLELRFTELGLYYPTVESQIPVFEEIALDVIPGLRDSA
jgi:alkanesulfonate monooxygenase SsuD/methylene tetrahydromethanopterin reductase-like flavin-dependent oxidoreductase (luciferase family)